MVPEFCAVETYCGGIGVAAVQGVEHFGAVVDAFCGSGVAEPGLCKAEEHYSEEADVFSDSFLKSIFEKFVRSCRSKDSSVAFDVTDLVEISSHVCSKHVVILKDLSVRFI